MDERRAAPEKIAALILNWNGGELTERAVLSVTDQVERVVVVDNASTPAERERLAQFASEHGVLLIQNETNIGYAAGNNVGLRRVLDDGYDAVLVMNNDAEAEPGAVQLMTEYLASDPEIGAVGPTVVDMARPDSVMHTGLLLDFRTGKTGFVDQGVARDERRTQPFPTGAVSGAAFLAPTEVFRRCGVFDERFIFYYEDIEWSARLRRAGWKLMVVPQAVFRHVFGASMPTDTGVFYQARNRPIFFRLALGYSRIRALLFSAPSTLHTMAWLVRHRKPWMAIRSALYGWLLGLVARD
jgi:GT2 family glycosyltransferase